MEIIAQKVQMVNDFEADSYNNTDNSYKMHISRHRKSTNEKMKQHWSETLSILRLPKII